MDELPLTTPQTHSNKLIIISLAGVLVAALAAGGGVYFYQKAKNDEAQKDLQAQINDLKSKVADSGQVANPTPTPTLAPTVTTTPNPTATWKIYASSTYNVSFKYPENLAAPRNSIETTETAPIGLAKAEIISFLDDKLSPSLMVSSSRVWVEDYAPLLKTLQQTYEKRSVTSNLAKDYPYIVNAANVASTTPQYIESSDGIYRGVYWYGYYGQDFDSSVKSLPLNNLNFVVTDNKNTVIQMHKGVAEANTTPVDCVVNVDEAKGKPCALSSSAADVLSTYRLIIESLKNS